MNRSTATGDESPDAEAVLLNQAALGSLQDCLEGLPLEFREAIILRELEELSYKEISGYCEGAGRHGHVATGASPQAPPGMHGGGRT